MQEHNKKILNSEEETLAWYLKKGTLTWISFLVPPLAYLIIFTNYKKLSPNLRSNSLFFTNLMMCGWVLKLLPKNTFTYLLACALFAFSVFLIALKIRLMMKE